MSENVNAVWNFKYERKDSQFTWSWVIESLDEGDDGTLAGATAADQSYGFAGGHIQGEIIEDPNIGPWWVREIYIF